MSAIHETLVHSIRHQCRRKCRSINMLSENLMKMQKFFAVLIVVLGIIKAVHGTPIVGGEPAPPEGE